MEHKIAKGNKFRKWLLLFQLVLLFVAVVFTILVYIIDSIPRYNIDRNALEAIQLNNNYTNIAFFGLDTRIDDDGPSRSDTIMIASINNSTGEIRIVSVFRDTLMQQQDGTLDKAAHAYAFGGPAEAVAMLNRNLDLDIEKYITVIFASLAAIIDAIGGIEVEASFEELYQINLHSPDTANNIGRPVPPPISEEQQGRVTLNGIQAVAFTRIRFTEGGDFRRAERQREVLEEIMRKITTANPVQLIRVMNEVAPDVVTNMTTWEILGQGFNIIRRNMGEMEGYPFDLTTGYVSWSNANYVIPINASNNVRELHRFLFDDYSYQPTERMNGISDNISWSTGLH